MRIGESIVRSTEKFSNKTLVVEQSLGENDVQVEVDQTGVSGNSAESIFVPAWTVLVETRIPRTIKDTDLNIDIQEGAVSVGKPSDSTASPAGYSVFPSGHEQALLDDGDVEVQYTRITLEVAESTLIVARRLVFESGSTEGVESVPSSFEDVDVDVDSRARVFMDVAKSIIGPTRSPIDKFGVIVSVVAQSKEIKSDINVNLLSGKSLKVSRCDIPSCKIGS